MRKYDDEAFKYLWLKICPRPLDEILLLICATSLACVSDTNPLKLYMQPYSINPLQKSLPETVYSDLMCYLHSQNFSRGLNTLATYGCVRAKLSGRTYALGSDCLPHRAFKIANAYLSSQKVHRAMLKGTFTVAYGSFSLCTVKTRPGHCTTAKCNHAPPTLKKIIAESPAERSCIRMRVWIKSDFYQIAAYYFSLTI